MEDKNTVSIFQGPTVEADAVHDYLAQNGIGALVRNHMQENLDAGWVTASPDNAAEVFVGREDELQARDLMRNLYHEGISESPVDTTLGTTPATPPPPAANPAVDPNTEEDRGTPPLPPQGTPPMA